MTNSQDSCPLCNKILINYSRSFVLYRKSNNNIIWLKEPYYLLINNNNNNIIIKRRCIILLLLLPVRGKPTTTTNTDDDENKNSVGYQDCACRLSRRVRLLLISHYESRAVTCYHSSLFTCKSTAVPVRSYLQYDFYFFKTRIVII